MRCPKQNELCVVRFHVYSELAYSQTYDTNIV